MTLNKKTLRPKVMKNNVGFWAYIDDPHFYIETKEYSTIRSAVEALKKKINPIRYMVDITSSVIEYNKEESKNEQRKAN